MGSLKVEEEANYSPPPPPPSLPAAGDAVVVGKVARAQEILARLGDLLMVRGEVEECSLVEEAWRSLSEVITSLLEAKEHSRGPPAAAGRAAEGYGVTKKKCRAEEHGDKRGAKRSRSNQYICNKVSSKTLEDGYTWRKYGQKEIQNAKNPRSYYRCTHKPDRGCQAQKQAQLCETDSTTYVITYIGQHTCRDAPHPGAVGSSNRYIINFGPGEPPAPLPALKNNPDLLDAEVSGVSHDDGSLTEYLSPAPDETAYTAAAEGASATSLLPATATTQASEAVSSEHGDVTSELHPSMDFAMEDFNFDFLDVLDGELDVPSWPCF